MLLHPIVSSITWDTLHDINSPEGPFCTKKITALAPSLLTHDWLSLLQQLSPIDAQIANRNRSVISNHIDLNSPSAITSKSVEKRVELASEIAVIRFLKSLALSFPPTS